MKKIIFILTLINTLVTASAFADRISIDSITATSTLNSSDEKYNVKNLTDHRITSWAEGENDNGKGTSINIKFNGTVELDHFFIKNGNGDFRLFYANNRVMELEAAGDGGTKALIILKDAPGFQMVQFKTPLRTSRLTLTIKSVYPGELYDDTFLAEISFEEEWLNLDHEGMNSTILSHYENQIKIDFENQLKSSLKLSDRDLFSPVDSRHSDILKDYLRPELIATAGLDGSVNIIACLNGNVSLINTVLKKNFPSSFYAAYRVQGKEVLLNMKAFPCLEDYNLEKMCDLLSLNEENAQFLEAFAAYKQKVSAINACIKNNQPLCIEEGCISISEYYGISYHLTDEKKFPLPADFQLFLDYGNQILTNYSYNSK